MCEEIGNETLCIIYKNPGKYNLDDLDKANAYSAIANEVRKKFNLKVDIYISVEKMVGVAPIVKLEGCVQAIDVGLDYLIQRLGWPRKVEKPSNFIFFGETSKRAYKLFKEKCEKNQKRLDATSYLENFSYVENGKKFGR